MNLSHLLREAEELPTDASPEYVQETLAKLRAALADGLEGHRDQLRAFLTLADKFGSHSDAWNAAMLLEASGELDSHARRYASPPGLDCSQIPLGPAPRPCSTCSVPTAGRG